MRKTKFHRVCKRCTCTLWKTGFQCTVNELMESKLIVEFGLPVVDEFTF